MLTQELLKAHIVRSGGTLYHVTSGENVEAIEREGIKPGSELGKSTRDDYFKTRPGHVYLIQKSDVPIVEVGPEPRVFAVDLAQLEPAFLAPDEDIVAENFRDAVASLPPRRECDERSNELPGQEGNLADWADSVLSDASSELTARSLDCGRVSYRGTIPPVALELMDTPSPALVAFSQNLPDSLRGHLKEPPPAGDGGVEVARARAVLREAGLRVCALVGKEIEIRVGDVYQCRLTWHALGPVIQSLHANGRLEAGIAVGFVREAIREAEELGELPFPRDQLRDASDIAGTVAQMIGRVAGLAKFDEGECERFAHGAFAAAADLTRVG